MIRTKKGTIIFCIGAVLILAALVVGCAGKSQEQKQPLLDEEPYHNFSKLTWTQAFEKLNETMDKQYAFTQWKSIKWQDLQNKYLPQIKAAETEGSFENYYLTLRAYINEIPDGHVMMRQDQAIDYKYKGGAFGFAATLLEDETVMVTWVDPNSQAHIAGLKIGDEITQWDGKPISSAIQNVPLLFFNPSATKELEKQKQLTGLVRAPIGTKVTLTLSDFRSVVLTAYDDQNLSIQKSYPYTVVSIDKLKALSGIISGEKNPAYGPKGVVETEMMEGNILYVKLWGLMDLDTENTGTPLSTVELMRQAVIYANEKNCAGMILDLRNNLGGIDEMTAELLGLFYREKTLYEYQKYTVNDTLPVLYIEPDQKTFDGKIIAIVNSQCISCGEGVAQFIKNLPNGETLGFYGTNGSFGMAGATIELPGGIWVKYPFGQSLDKDKIVQIDSRNGVGGVSPSILIPMNKENALKMASGQDVELKKALNVLQGIETK